MFKDAKVGDRVWNLANGFGKIVEIYPKAKFSLVVEFHGVARKTFNYDGREFNTDTNPTLFFDEIKFEIPKKPLPKLEVDTKVIVWDNHGSSNKFKRYFSHFNEDGRIAVFINGTTSWSNRGGHVSSYNNWKLVK